MIVVIMGHEDDVRVVRAFGYAKRIEVDRLSVFDSDAAMEIDRDLLEHFFFPHFVVFLHFDYITPLPSGT